MGNDDTINDPFYWENIELEESKKLYYSIMEIKTEHELNPEVIKEWAKETVRKHVEQKKKLHEEAIRKEKTHE